jgi:ferredoxin
MNKCLTRNNPHQLETVSAMYAEKCYLTIQHSPSSVFFHPYDITMRNCSKMLIYYFSGTGNARQAARWVAACATAEGVGATVVNIADIDRKHVAPPSPDALVGFCSPTHGFNLPPIMLSFVWRFPRGRNRVFIINTRAGMKLGKVALPGLSGVAQLLPALILLLKGYRIVGMRPIDLPSNWISLHPGLKDNAIDFLFLRFKGITHRFAERIVSGKSDYRALWDLLQDCLVAPIAIGYYFVGRFAFAKSFYASQLCDNCGVCIKQCTVHAISIVDGRPFWSYRCESCMRCMNNCPKGAIDTAHGYVIGTLLILSLVIQPLIYDTLSFYNIRWFDPDIPFSAVSRFASSAIITFTVMVGSYWCVHYMRRWGIVRTIMKYTSLTSFRFWRRYKPSTREMERRGVV